MAEAPILTSFSNVENLKEDSSVDGYESIHDLCDDMIDKRIPYFEKFIKDIDFPTELTFDTFTSFYLKIVQILAKMTDHSDFENNAIMMKDDLIFMHLQATLIDYFRREKLDNKLTKEKHDLLCICIFMQYLTKETCIEKFGYHFSFIEKVDKKYIPIIEQIFKMIRVNTIFVFEHNNICPSYLKTIIDNNNFKIVIRQYQVPLELDEYFPIPKLTLKSSLPAPKKRKITFSNLPHPICEPPPRMYAQTPLWMLDEKYAISSEWHLKHLKMK